MNGKVISALEIKHVSWVVVQDEQASRLQAWDESFLATANSTSAGLQQG
jgi:hypothetical protein